MSCVDPHTMCTPIGHGDTILGSDLGSWDQKAMQKSNCDSLQQCRGMQAVDSCEANQNRTLRTVIALHSTNAQAAALVLRRIAQEPP